MYKWHSIIKAMFSAYIGFQQHLRNVGNRQKVDKSLFTLHYLTSCLFRFKFTQLIDSLPSSTSEETGSSIVELAENLKLYILLNMMNEVKIQKISHKRIDMTICGLVRYKWNNINILWVLYASDNTVTSNCIIVIMLYMLLVYLIVPINGTSIHKGSFSRSVDHI